MNMRLVLCLCLCVVVARAAAAKKAKPPKPENIEETYGDFVPDAEVQQDYFDDVDDDDEEDPAGDETSPDDIESDKPTVVISSKPQVFVALLGETVRLPCDAPNTEGVRIWKKDEALLYQGLVGLSHMNHTKIHPDGSLEVNLTTASDFGTYNCQLLITNDYTPSINHTILEHSAPKITAITTAGNRTVYKPGETVTMRCHAKGTPKPEISWHKGNPSENFNLKGEDLTIPDLKWNDGGMYRCLASNDLRPAAHAHITINVLHTPVITTKKYLINSDHKHTAELKCTVHGFPQPTVLWMRNGENIIKSDKFDLRHSNRQEGVERTLIIKDLTEEDFGDYVCLAKNSQGKSTQTIRLVKTPAVQEFVGPNRTAKDVVLMWRVESKSPIQKHELQYKRKGDGEWRNAEPEVTEGRDGVYTVKFTLSDLELGDYETRVRSRNEHGWSEFSDVMPFEGVSAKPGSTHKNHHKKHHKEKETREKHISPSPTEGTPAQQPEPKQRESTVRGTTNGGISMRSSTTSIFGLCLLILFCSRQ